MDADPAHVCQRARPSGKNLAIAEWPRSPMDRRPRRLRAVCRSGGRCHRRNQRKHKDVSGVIHAGQTLPVGYIIHGSERLAERAVGQYKVPFLFATNGRLSAPATNEEWHLVSRRAAIGESSGAALKALYAGRTARSAETVTSTTHDRLALEPMPYIDRDYQ